MNIPILKNANLNGKKILLRCDLNVPLSDKGMIEDNTRIVESLETIKYILANGGKVIILTHLGRPDGKFVEDLKVDVIAIELQSLLKTKVIKLNDCIGEEIKSSLNSIASDVVLLENTRFHAEEEENDENFAKQLASYADIFVNDAFGTVHRAHASTAGVAKFLPSYAGLLLQKEIDVLSSLLENPKKPVCLLTGGAKIDTKIGILNNFLNFADFFLIGGALANTFLAAQGKNIGSSLFEIDKLEVAKKFLIDADKMGKKVLLPVDVVVAKEISIDATAETVDVNSVLSDMKILDLGLETIKSYKDAIDGAATVIWNGPMGLYEFPQFEAGSRELGFKISEIKITSIIGGGDTIDAINKFNIPLEKYTHVSTGGGAMLEFLEGKILPGIQALMSK